MNAAIKKKGLLFVLAAALLLTACAGNPSVTGDGEKAAESAAPAEQTQSADGEQDAPKESAPIEGAVNIRLDDDGITVDGAEVSRNSADAVYAANDIVFYLEGQDFTYGEGDASDAHSQEEADAHTVLHITKPGTYALSGTLSAGQIAVDLGEGSEEDPDAVVTLILNGADITCTVAPGIIFYRVYECGTSDTEGAVKEVDTSGAGANLVIADGTENIVRGAYVAKIYKSYTLNEAGTEVTDSKKLHKYDGAVYSRMSMNVRGGEQGDGILMIEAENEGLDTELHLTVEGGDIRIVSGNDGINTNEDGVSVTAINGGTVSIWVTGTTGEGDGIDSNGWLVVNGGTVTTYACGTSSDAGIDSDMGIYLNGGTLIATGNMYDAVDGGDQTYVIFQFRGRQKGGETYTLRNADGEEVLTVTPANAFTYLIVSSAALTEGDYTLWQGDTQLAGTAGGGTGGFGGGRNGERPERPDGAEFGQRPEPPEGAVPHWNTENGERPELPEDAASPFDPENGERPEPPEGMENGQEPPMPWGSQDGGSGANPGQSGETSATFPIRAGGNFFTGITAL